jgi:hypothetical protein
MSAAAELDRDSDSPGTPFSASPPQVEARGSAREQNSAAPSSQAVGAKGATARPPAMPSEEQLLDVLYEMLAQGVPPRSTLTQEQVERFLHQHARETKPVTEMLAFFEAHGLPTDAGAYGADRELGELASGLQKERNSLQPGFGPVETAAEPAGLAQALPPASAPQFAPGAPPARAFVVPVLENEPTGRRTQPVAPPAKGSGWLGVLVAALVSAALVALGLNYQRATSLEQRLDQARMQQRSTDAALTKLEQRAESLQGALKQSEQERQQQTSQLQTTLEQQAKRRANEELAIERMLGLRYQRLRQKYTDQTVAPRP